MSQEDMQKGMEAWGVWAASCGDGLVDMGTPLMGGLKLSPDGSSPSDREVTEYSILQADDIAGAEALLQRHPHLGYRMFDRSSRGDAAAGWHVAAFELKRGWMLACRWLNGRGS